MIDPTPENIRRLSISPSFGCLTRTALEMEIENRYGVQDGESIIYFDLDRLKQANERFGKANVNIRVRESVGRRSRDCLYDHDELLGQWFSGDEFVAILPSKDAHQFCQRVRDELIKNDMNATFIISDCDESHDADIVMTRIGEMITELDYRKNELNLRGEISYF